jgi:hypothetical protein
LAKTIRKFKGIEFEETAVIAFMLYEGLTFQEAVLSYKARQNLPATAFCGPNRSYPAHDAKRIHNGFARLSQFGHRLEKNIVSRIHAGLVRKAKDKGIEHSECKHCRKGSKKKIEETVAWFLQQHPDLFKIKSEGE